ncbi:alpha/beta hydrolase [Lacticaseibacillus jixianensis]|uniref:Alpha/beta hydrolase n=1 Tax=Lacticaseibacillus jixianensis TaxID=2486012 RepID=A0ABW4B7K7_9LACO|nr:alpha/beta hydrolase [Lacticaseibacillus jixianensis]
MQIQTDVVYDSEHALKLDIYGPDGVARGGIIQIHGGGWFRGDKAKDADWAQRWAARQYEVIVPNYRIAPAFHYPAAQADMDTLMAWVKKTRLPFDKAHLAAVGSSAGGNMAVELAIKYGIPAISLSGILDIGDWLAHHEAVQAEEGDTSDFNQRASATINQDGPNDPFYKWFITNYIAPADYAKATPAPRVTAQTGPLYLANSLNEFVPTSGLFQMGEAMSAAQVPFVLRTVVGSRHAKGYLDDVFDELNVFLNKVL